MQFDLCIYIHAIWGCSITTWSLLELCVISYSSLTHNPNRNPKLIIDFVSVSSEIILLEKDLYFPYNMLPGILEVRRSFILPCL